MLGLLKATVRVYKSKKDRDIERKKKSELFVTNSTIEFILDWLLNFVYKGAIEIE